MQAGQKRTAADRLKAGFYGPMLRPAGSARVLAFCWMAGLRGRVGGHLARRITAMWAGREA